MSQPICTISAITAADTVVAAAAAARHGIVTRAQLLQLGVTAREIDWRVERRLLLGRRPRSPRW
ncbi:MAG: hypothetical protein KY431_02110 [Actinobacteria bacterium]|nr:hypothetical protein [Actinomycetota bacterium]